MKSTRIHFGHRVIPLFTLLAAQLLLLVCLLSWSSSTQAALGDAFSTAGSTLEFTSGTHSYPPTNNWGPNYKRPYPTNTWWINLVLAGNNPIVTFPYMIRVDSQYNLCYPGRTVAKNYIFNAMIDNLSMGATQSVGQRVVMNHDDLSVTVQFNSGGNYMRSPIVRGQTYHTVEYSGLTPRISTIHAILSVSSLSGTKFKISMNNGQTWIIYSSSSITFTRSGNSLVATGPFNGWLRAAMVLDPASMESTFDAYSGAYPSGGTVTYTVSNDVATIQFNWQKKGSGTLMMFSLPHHRDILQNPRYASPNVRYRGMKGYMDAVIGDTWVMRENLVKDIGFYGRYEIVNTAARNAIISALNGDQNSYPAPKDPYFGGKAVARLGRLAVIADELGQTSIASKIRGNMKTYFNKWLGGAGYTASDNKMVYERTYGGIVSKNSVGSAEADFGQYYYNDHHFHYGYFVYAAACIIKKDQAWGNENRAKIYEIVRDFGNPSNADPAFTKLRNKDWYVGHSFAAGLFAFADSRNQESTSEAVNAYYGMYLLGLVLKDQNLLDLGRILMQTEIRSSQKYWQITSASDIYDEPFKSNKVVGILWETKVDYATFFGANAEFIHGIQMLPITPIAEDLLPGSWVRESYEVFKSAYGTASQGWLGILLSAQAQFDLAGATPRILSLNGYDDGNTRTNTLYWLYTRPNGQAKRANPFADIDGSNYVPSPSPSPAPSPTPSPAPSPTPSPAPSPTPSPPPSTCPTCGSGTSTCGNVCYNPLTYDCCTGDVVAPKGTCTAPSPAPSPPPPSTDTACQTVVCPSGMSCCGGACYDKAVYTCYDGRLCPSGTQRCGDACYNPNIFCCSNGQLRPKGSC